MITNKQIKIYEKYGGELEGFELEATSNEKDELKRKDWLIIDSFIQDLQLIKKKLVSKNYKGGILSQIEECIEQNAIDFLITLS